LARKTNSGEEELIAMSDGKLKMMIGATMDGIEIDVLWLDSRVII
jgi:hypothetical protein